MKKQMYGAQMASFFISILLLCAALFGVAFVFSGTPAQAAETRSIIFPVIGGVTYYDDFGAPRSGGRKHEGNDMMGRKMLPLVATVDGTVRFVAYPEPSYGYMVSIEDAEGWRYNYLHINNDTPGTDDKKGGGINAYAPDMNRSYPVVAGQLIGWMGDSGNAETTSPHLHFEIRDPDGTPISPYNSLKAAQKILKPVTPPTMPGEILPYGQFRGGAAVATGEIDPSIEGLEAITGAGPGGGPQVRVFSQVGALLSQFFAFDESFKGGIDVTEGDLNGDGAEEIIVGAGPGGVPNVRAFDAKGNLVLEFSAYNSGYRGGVVVASADMDGNGIDEIITGTGPGGGPQVRIFDATGKLLGQFFAFSPNFRGGIDVAAVSTTEFTSAAIIASAGPGGGPQVRIFDGKGTVIGQFYAYNSEFRGGVRIDGVNLFSEDGTAYPVVATSPASGGSPDFRAYFLNGDLLGQFSQFEEWWRGGYDIAIGGDGNIIVASLAGSVSPTGGRRTSVRYAEQSD